MARQVDLHGRVIIKTFIEAVTGLHIGKGKEGVSIGGVDNPVIRDPLSNEPYIPGSSLKGKLRSLSEKREPGLAINFPRGSQVQIHVCESGQSYRQCPVCRMYGVPGDKDWSAPTRLLVRDVRLTKDSRIQLRSLDTEVPFTEVKYEAAIDRVTSAANPRPLERVPAGAVFGPCEIIVSIYEPGDVTLLGKLFEAFRLLEDDYLGGAGSRGSGQVRFRDFEVTVKPVSKYAEAAPTLSKVTAADTSALLQTVAELTGLVTSQILPAGEARHG